MLATFIRFSLALILMVPYSIHGLVYKITTWQHARTGQQVSIVHNLAADYLQSDRTDKQQADLMNAIVSKHAYVIYSDLTDYTGNQQGVLNLVAAIQSTANQPSGALIALLEEQPADTFDYSAITQWQQANRRTLLTGLGTLLHKAHISYVNAEGRYLTMASGLGHPTNLSDALKETQDLINAIENFDDGRECNAYYKERIEDFKQANSDIVDQQELAIPLDFDKSLIQSAMLCPFIRVVHYGEELTDARVIHELAQAKDRPYVFLVLPGDNAQAVNQAMPRFGYEPLTCFGTDYWRDELQGRMAFYPIDIAAAFNVDGGLPETVSKQPLGIMDRLKEFIRSIMSVCC